MTTKFTAGPWEVSKHATPEYAPQYGVYAENQNDHVIVKGENAKADAGLIAAAPDLLEACNQMLGFLLECNPQDPTISGPCPAGHPNECGTCATRRKAEAAIAKAEGNA